MIFKENSPNLGKSTHSLNPYNQSRSPTSSLPRREILWNIVQPGDPYDIRQSTINRIHNDNKKFMGQNPQLVCLLQAAQIQRLNQFLSDYYHKYRDLQRKQLDRHSYQIQIKQLHEQLNSTTELRNQNSKMNQFIKKLTQQNIYLKSRNSSEDDSNLQYYHQQINGLNSLNNELKKQNDMLNYELKNLQTKFAIMQETKNRTIQSLNLQLTGQKPFKTNSPNFNIQNSEVNNLKIRYESQITRLQHQMRRINEQLDHRNYEIKELSNKNTYLLKQIQAFEATKTQILQTKSNDPATQAKIGLLSMQIQRLNLIINQYTANLDEKSNNQMIIQQKYDRLSKQYQQLDIAHKQLRNRYNNLENKSFTTTDQNQVNRLNTQIVRLQQQRTKDIKNYNLLLQKLKQLQFYYNSDRTASNNNQSYIKQLQIINKQLKINVSELQNRVAFVSQELQRLKLQANSKINTQEYITLKNTYNNLQNQFEFYRRNTGEQSQNIINHYEQQIIQLKKYYEQRIMQLANNNNTAINNANRITFEFQSKIQSVSRETNRLNSLIQQKNKENISLRNTVFALQQKIYEQYQVQAQRKSQQYQNTIRQLRNTIQQQSLRQRQNQTKIRQMYELQRQNQQLHRQLESLRRQLEYKNRNQGNINKTMENYVMQLRGLGQDNNKLRVQLRNMVQMKNRLLEYENRNSIMVREIQNLNQNLKLKIQNLNRSQIIINNLKQDISRASNSHTQNINIINQKAYQEISNYKNQVNNLQNKLVQLQQQNKQLQQQNKQLLTNHQQTSLEYNQSRGSLQQTLTKLSNLQKTIQNRTIQQNRSQQLINSQKVTINNLQMEIQQLQRTINQKYQFEYRRNITMMEEKTKKLHIQLQQWKRKQNQAENRYRMQQGDLDVMRQNFNGLKTENQRLKMDLRRINDDSVSKFNLTQKQIQNLQSQRNTLKNKILQLQNSVIVNLNHQNQQHMIKNHELQSKNNNLLSEITFLKNTLSTNSPQIASQYQQRMRQLQIQLQTSQKSLKQMEISHNRKYQYQIKQLTQYHQQQTILLQNQLNSLKDRNSQLQRINNNYRMDIDQLHKNLQKHNLQTENLLRSRLKEHQINLLQRIESQHAFKLAKYEQNMEKIKNQLFQCQQYNKEYLHQLQLSKKKYYQLQNTLRQQQNNNQISNYQQRIVELQNTLHIIDRNRQQLENQVSVLRSHTHQPHQHDHDHQHEQYTEYHKTAQMRYNQYENKIRYLEQQNNNLTQQISNKNQQLTRLSSQLWSMRGEFQQLRKQLQQQYNINHKSQKYIIQQKQQLRNSRLNQQVNNNNQHYQNQINRLIKQLQALNKQNSNMRAKYQNKIQILKSEIQRLTEMINQLNKANESKQKQDDNIDYESYLIERDNKIRQQQQQINRFGLVVKQKQQNILKFKADIEQLLIEVESYRRIINSNQQNSQDIAFQQIQKLQYLLKQKSTQYEQLYHKYKQLISIEEEFLQMSEEFQSSKKHIVHYEQSIQKLYAEFERLQGVINELKTQRQQYFDKSQRLKKEVEKLKKSCNGQDQEIKQLRLNLSDQISLQKRVKEYMSLMVVLFAQIETLRGQLVDREEYSSGIKTNIVHYRTGSRISQKVA